MNTTTKQLLKATIIACIAVVTITLLVCNPKHSNNDMAQNGNLRWLDDSIAALAPSALQAIERGMNEANDSTTYYEYVLREARYYSLTERPERADTLIDRVTAFVMHQDDGYYAINGTCLSPRLNSLIAGAKACQAARYMSNHRDPRHIVSLYNDTYQLLLNSDSKHNLPKTCANMADAFLLCNDLTNAAKWYRRALFLVDSLDLPQKENITLYMGLAQIYLTLRNYNKAKLYYDQTEPHVKEMSPSMQAYYINNLGNFYYFQGDYKHALLTFLRMKKMLEQHGMVRTFDMYLCKINLADVFLNLGKLNDATAMLDDVEPYFRAQGDNTSIYYCNTIRFGIAVRAGRMQEAGRLMADKTDESLIPYTLVNIRNRYKRRYYELTGNYDKAYALLNRSIAYNDSIEHNLSNMRSAEIMSRFTTDTLQLHRDLAIEHKNAEIQSIKFTSTLAISIAVTSILLLILWYLYLRKRRFKIQLRMMNLKLDNIRNRISPHFMFNVLNNRIIKSDVKESNELTELAQLIRANLDMSSTLGVELQKELEFVQQYIRVESYLMGDDFHFNIDIAPDVDTSSVRIPSMFIQIMTENSIKHALRNKEGIKLLSITVRREQHNTVIRVTDNGPGFNHATLRRKTGMNIISQTIAVINVRNKDKIRFAIRNIYSPDGQQTKGCEATLKVPDGVKIE
ncbi:histidine kinase [uncultured Prevotella sp.]|uniref:histidine kinase n=1 Tax=uncultured Prevotella sp. TaxID=159272 RepID=UPI002604D9C3|nr:histidine kinase [uncultured Prevotella sp.]